jgi:hypothetical protein
MRLHARPFRLTHASTPLFAPGSRVACLRAVHAAFTVASARAVCALSAMRGRTGWLPPAALALLVTLATAASAATTPGAYLFTDSPNPAEYIASWGYATAPSQLALVNVSHVPADTAHVFLGSNALRLAWTSATGGDWMLAVAPPGWVPVDTSPYDTLVFVVWSPTSVPAADLPDLLLEDADNVRTPRHPMSAYLSGAGAGVWTRVPVPLSVFRDDPGAADLTRINKVFFAQGSGSAANTPYMLYVDEIRFVTAGSFTLSAPAATVRTFERHLELRWEPASMSNVERVRIERQAGSQWQRVSELAPDDGCSVDWLGAPGVSSTYRLTAFGWHLNTSGPTAPVGATTTTLSDDQWLDVAEEDAFRYFWHHGHPASGLARERYGAGDVCATGGTGMGIMAMIAGSERSYAPRAEIAARVKGILDFYATKAVSYHGAYSHWLNGTTGATIPFDYPTDFSGDIVETSYLMEGILAARQYFNGSDTTESSIRALATQLWEGVDWDAYRPASPGNVIYWKWSPTEGFTGSFPVQGWNECLVIYLLAKASPTHPVPAYCYTQGYTRNGAIANGKVFWGYPLWVGPDYGGPLFFAHYSFLGFDPRYRRDALCNYWAQNHNHTVINRHYCTLNPGHYAGYSDSTWGLTASDNPWGYGVQAPYSGDNGTLTPTAPLSSMPYAPSHGLAALKGMYRSLGQRLWGPFGPWDAYNPGQNWYSGSYIAIDEGPIAVMIENHRSGLLWDRFMRNPEIAPALDSLGFVWDYEAGVPEPGVPNSALRLAARPNPARGAATLDYELPVRGPIRLAVFDLEGRRIATLADGVQEAGRHTVNWHGTDAGGRALGPGVYLVRIQAGGTSATLKLLRLR